MSIEALARRVRIPWDDLASIASPWWDLYGRAYRWRRRNGRGVTVSRRFPQIHRMLTEVERRAPHASVWS